MNVKVIWLLLTILLVGCVTQGTDRSADEGDTSRWKNVDRIVAVGDVHGDYDQFVRALRASGVIDDTGSWAAGETHLVQIGDIFDRGPDSRKVIDLLTRLESQALEAGGKVHVLIGNHEAMVLNGDWRFLHDGEWKSFGSQEAFRQAMSPEGIYGQAIRERNAVITINNVLFVHAGISPKYAGIPLEDINARVRTDLDTYRGIVRDPLGPLWYRGWVVDDEEEVYQSVQRVLSTHKVEHVVVGHSVVPEITSRARGTVIAIDLGMSSAYGGRAGALVIENGDFYEQYFGEERHPLY
jgi:hypothetical protein